MVVALVVLELVVVDDVVVTHGDCPYPVPQPSTTTVVVLAVVVAFVVLGVVVIADVVVVPQSP